MPKQAFKLTDEQQACIEAFGTGEDIAITAGAGAAKTTTCKEMAKSTDDRGAYIAFNASIAAEAKATFPRNVMCKTMHGFAMGPVGSKYWPEKGGKPQLYGKQLAQFLSAQPFKLPTGTMLAPWAIARMAKETVQNFCHSASEEINKYHLPKTPGAEDVRDELAAFVIPYANRIWNDYTNLHGALKWGKSHDPYLKMAQLKVIQIPGDFFMLDEAQDTNPCSQSIFENQDGQLIAVGDANQQIYGWRGAEDYMDKMEAEHRLTLSQSFRFGPPIAEEANRWLELLESELRIKGFNKIKSIVTSLDDPDAVLCRTNAEVIAQAMHFGDEGKSIAVVGGTDEIKRLAESAIALQQGRTASHPDLIAFKNWSEVKEYVAEEGGDLQVFVRLIDTYGADVVLKVADTAVDERYADVTLSTAHKAKGREWEKVKIGNDFQPTTDNETGEEKELTRSEMMLAYVSITRAKNYLDRGSLDRIDQLSGRNSSSLSTHPEVIDA